jgi:hypothetical protein
MELDKKIHSRSYSRSHSSREKKKPHKELILLNYGIEIETVFELINEHNTYYYYSTFYKRNSRQALQTLIIFLKILKYNIKYNEDEDNDEDEYITNLIHILNNNEIYENLRKIIIIDITNDIDNFDDIQDCTEAEIEALFHYFDANEKKLIEIMDGVNDENEEEKISIFTELMNKWKDFLNNAIMIISYLIKTNELKIGIRNPMTISNYGNKIINVLLNGTESPTQVYENFINRFDLRNSKIKLYNNNADNINEFYGNIHNSDDEILLNLTVDTSVNCNNKKLYKTISNPEVIDYKYLLNNCEFITQVFKTTDEIEQKLSIFFNNDIINKSLLNCSKTSQHVHISFNIQDKIILPDIYIIISIVCVCHYFQDKIFDLFLITRTNNLYCNKLNYNLSSGLDLYDFINNDINYNENLNKIMKIFYTDDKTNIDNKFFWLNLVNLYKLSDNIRPYTIEFRIKHGSNDATELKNVCILYENIINYAIKLSDLIKSKTNIIECKFIIDDIISKNTNYIFNNKILLNIYDYFKDDRAEYVIGLNKLNKIFTLPSEKHGGVIMNRKKYGISRIQSKAQEQAKSKSKAKAKANISRYIRLLETKPIYKRNSFGFNYIGNGLDNELKTQIFNNNLLTIENVNRYLNLNNIYI